MSMPMKRETGKDRWKRVPKDYFKKPDGITKAKLWLSGLACVAALGWWASGVDWSGDKASTTDLNSLRTNHGEVARVHAAWENKCDACHEPFQPIDGRGLFSSTAVADQSSDKLCMSCHAGPSHHESMIKSEVKTCSECHRDHQGRDFSMVRLVDGECTSCHSKLDDHIDMSKKPGGGRMYGNVTAFNAKDHPPFRPEGAQPGDNDSLQDKSKLKFNHALHMRNGIVRDEKETPYTVDKIPIAAERARYQNSGTLQDPVQLECASCHVLDSTELKAAPNPAVGPTALPARNPGRYFLPVNYETQCRACHTQTFDPRPDLKDLEVPHGVQPDQVVAFLKRVYSEQAIGDDPSVLNRKVSAIPLPGKRPDDSTAGKLLDESVTKATKFLFENRTSCLECHTVETDAKGLPTKVEPTKVPDIWFKHAAFDHTAHRGVSCRDCHPRSYALEADGKTPSKEASVVATDVLIPAIDNCVQCHAPAKKEAGMVCRSVSSTTGGASFDCTECHRYHNGDNPLQGPGASAQDADRERSIAEFLTGTGGQPARPSTAKPEKP